MCIHAAKREKDKRGHHAKKMTNLFYFAISLIAYGLDRHRLQHVFEKLAKISLNLRVRDRIVKVTRKFRL